MPLVSEATHFGWACKFYDNGIVKVGTATSRFSLRTSAGDHFASLLRAELIKRKLADADALFVDADGVGERAQAASVAASVHDVEHRPAERRTATSTLDPAGRKESKLEIEQPPVPDATVHKDCQPAGVLFGGSRRPPSQPWCTPCAGPK